MPKSGCATEEVLGRFVVSHRRAEPKARVHYEKVARDAAAFAEIVSEQRGITRLQADPRDIEAKRRELPAGVIVEPEWPRRVARYHPAADAQDASTGAAGIGAALDLTIRAAGLPLAAAEVVVAVANLQSGKQILLGATTGASGRATITFNPAYWFPAAVTVTPPSAYWSWFRMYPRSGAIELPPLARNGPLGWWHRLLGISQYSPRRGSGIRIGIIDTGVGPHPYLAHGTSAGAFIDGAHSTNAADISEHGTHVAGIIGARPDVSSPDFAGIAPGAEIVYARVFPPGKNSTANNGDIAAAIDAMVQEHRVDLLNLSLGGTRSSEIEHDAIQAALDDGVLVLCASGNGGSAVTYPAAYAGSVAVSAIGLLGAVPAGSVDALAAPAESAGFTANGLFAAAFNNAGPQVACVGPGVGIISTALDSQRPGAAPYAAMSGTSMACPAVTAALATWLAADPNFRNMPRDRNRAMRAWITLLRTLRPLGLGFSAEGYGLASALP